MLVWTVTVLTEEDMDNYWLDDAGMDSSWIERYRFGQLHLD